MSDNQTWEVVTKSKKAKNLEKKVEAHTEKKRLDAQLPKLEEILPSQQYRNLIAGRKPVRSSSDSPASSTGKSPKKSGKPAQSNKPTQNEAPKQQQVQKSVANKPKSLEGALRKITPDEFETELRQLQMVYPGSELLWLKGIATFLNTSLPFDSDPIFSGKSEHYPSNLLSRPLKAHLLDFLDSMGETNLSYFYHNLLVSIIMDMNANSPVIGYKLLLQLIGQNWPKVCSNNLAKTAVLRNSYQNRANIGLTIFWAIGQGGYKDLQEGIRVWQNLMLPLLGLKAYSKFVVEYVEKILCTSEVRTLTMNQSDFFTTYDALRAMYNGVSKDVQSSLTRSAEIFLQLYIDSSSKHANLFLTLLRDVEDVKRNRIELEGCIRCLIRGDDSFRVWKMNYKKKLVQSKILLKKIELEWHNSAAPLIKSQAFDEFLQYIRMINYEMAEVKRNDPSVDEIMAYLASLDAVLEKSSAQQKRSKQNGGNQKKKCGCCRWVLGSIFLVALIGGALAYDTQVNGKGVFERSATGKLLKQAGLLPHVEKAWYTTMSASARGYKWAEKHVPPYAKPAGKLACDLFKLARNTACNAFSALRDIINAKLPVASKFLEQYVPGLPKQIENASVTVKSVVVDVTGKVVTFFKTSVLVGRLSVENLSKALNQTQNLALEYVNLFHKKVDAYAKLK